MEEPSSMTFLFVLINDGSQCCSVHDDYYGGTLNHHRIVGR